MKFEFERWPKQEIKEQKSKLLKENAKGAYEKLDNFSFPVWRKEGVKAQYIDARPFGRRKVFTHPTEPYGDKKAFLSQNGISERKKVLTILGANWPALYVDLNPDAEITAVDQNLRQIEFLDCLIKNEEEFLKELMNNYQPFGLMKEVPFYPEIITKGRPKKEVFSKKDPKYQNFQIIRQRLGKSAEKGKLAVLNCDLEDLAKDAELDQIDYTDLSNVPELIGPEKTQTLIDALPDQALVYMAFLCSSKGDKEDFLTQLKNCRVIGQERMEKKGMSIGSMFLLEKTGKKEQASE